MPGVKDKLLLNEGGLAAGDCVVAGQADALQEQYSTAGIIAKEIEDAGLLNSPDALKFKSAVESICQNIDNAQDAYVKAQHEARLQLRELTDKMRVWFDQQSVKTP